MYSILISLIAYPFAAYYLHKYLSEYMDKGTARNLIVFIIASFISWAIGAGIDWAFPSQAINLF